MYNIKETAKEFDTYYSSYNADTEKLLKGLEKIYDKNISSYELKAKNIEYLCDNCNIKIFKNCPFFFEFSSGRERHTWGGLQSHIGSFLHEKTSDLWLDRYQADLSDDIENGYIYCWNNPVGFDHFSLGYDNILDKGFEKIIDDAENALKNVSNEKSRAFLSSVVQSVKALLHLAERFSKEAYNLAEKTENAEEKAHYLRIARTASKVPAKPPESFYEALAAVIFCREAVASLEGIGVSIFGHIDRMLEKYYNADIKSGKITYDEVKNLFHILFTYTDVRFETKKIFRETSTTINIGGCDFDGAVCFNDITKAVLDAVFEGRYVNTKIICRISSEHPSEYFEKIVKIQAANIPILVLLNDDVLIPARVKCGASQADARSYVNGGCHELVMQNSEVCTRADTWINLPKLLLDVLKKSHAKTFECFRQETLNEIKKYLLKIMEEKNKYEKKWCEYDPLPLCSSTFDGCIENAKDITEGGTKYSTTELSLLAPATLIDSLITIKDFVYDKKSLTLKELYNICCENFEGNETFRKQILANPIKYGAGNSEADIFAATMLSDISKLYKNEKGEYYKNGRGGDYIPAFYPHEIFRQLGKKTIATPDGRKAYTPLSRGCSPSEFIKLENPASVIKSLHAIDFTDFADSFCCEITLQNMDEEKNINVISALIKIFLQNKGSSLQFNLFDKEKLRKAQKNPDEHRDICVRVCGYSAVFVTLEKEIQDEIITRAIR